MCFDSDCTERQNSIDEENKINIPDVYVAVLLSGKQRFSLKDRQFGYQKLNEIMRDEFGLSIRVRFR